MKFFLLSHSHHRLTLLTLLSLRLAAGRETELVTFRFVVLRRVHAVHKKTVQAVQSWLKRKERKGGGRGGAARFQTDAQDVQGQSPWQQDSPFITSMKLEGRWKWLRRLSHCSWHVQLQRDYTHKRTRTQCLCLEWQWRWERLRESTVGGAAAASTRGLDE